MLDVQQWGSAPPLMIYSTQRGGVHGMDLRMERDAWVAPAPPKLGLLQQVGRWGGIGWTCWSGVDQWSGLGFTVDLGRVE